MERVRENGQQDFRLELLEAIKRDIRALLGPDRHELRAYYLDYRRVFRPGTSMPHPVERRAFLDHAQRSQVLFIGDFHTLPAAQEKALEVFEALLQRAQRPLTLCLEFLPVRAERAVKRFLAGRTSEIHFLEEMDYPRVWGFPWQSYGALLKRAREAGVPVVCLNTRGSLAVRDQRMASRLEESLRRNPDRLHVVLVGDLHLAPGHLPLQLARAFGLASSTTPRFTILYQNSETVFLTRMREGDPPLGWFHLAANRFVVNHVPPWSKMSTFLTWLETGGQSSALPLDDEDESALDDRLGWILRYLCHHFDVEAAGQDYHVVLGEDLAREFAGVEGAATLLRMAREGHPAVDPQSGLIGLARPSLAALVAGAMQGLRLSRRASPFLAPAAHEGLTDALHLVMAGQVAARLVNPALGAATGPDDWALFVRAWAARPLREQREMEASRAAHERAIAMRRMLAAGTCPARPFLRSWWNAEKKSGFRGLLVLGAWLAERLVAAHADGRVSKDDLRYILFCPCLTDPWNFWARAAADRLRASRPAWDQHARTVSDGALRRR